MYGCRRSHGATAGGGDCLMTAWPQRYWLVLSTFGLSVLLYVDRICISVAKEDVASDLQLSETQMGWVLSAFALGYALFQTPSGWLADRYGPRRVLSLIVVIWSVFTGLTAAAFGFASLLVTRLLFGAGEAGAFPGMARAIYSWIPMQERGLVQGINFSGSRVGGALALSLIPLMIEAIGWRPSFILLMGIGCGWAVFWYRWFRDDPTEHPGLRDAERLHILTTRQPRPSTAASAHPLPWNRLLGSPGLWLVSAQYFASNFTFFFCLTWLFPHLKETYALRGVEAGLYSAAPLVCGALGNWCSGWIVDRLYRRGAWVQSRRLPAMIGFALAAVGVTGSVFATTPVTSIAWFCLAIFGADMTLSPSWSYCIDIGRQHAGVVSGTMNMAGNLGSFVTALAFPYLAQWTGSYTPFFFIAAGLNGASILVWMFLDPRHVLETDQPPGDAA
jgi:MFS transporter, ACS family, glucarate transporter